MLEEDQWPWAEFMTGHEGRGRRWGKAMEGFEGQDKECVWWDMERRASWSEQHQGKMVLRAEV